MVSTAKAGNKQRHPRDSLNYIFLRSDRQLENLAKCLCLICYPVWQYTTLTFIAPLRCPLCWILVQNSTAVEKKGCRFLIFSFMYLYVLRWLDLNTSASAGGWGGSVVHWTLFQCTTGTRFLVQRTVIQDCGPHYITTVENHFNHQKWKWLDLDCSLILYQHLFSPMDLPQCPFLSMPVMLTLLTKVSLLQNMNAFIWQWVKV